MYHRLGSRMVHGRLLMILLAKSPKTVLGVVYGFHIVEIVATAILNTTWSSDVVSTNQAQLKQSNRTATTIK
jgi:hypothetical protein